MGPYFPYDDEKEDEVFIQESYPSGNELTGFTNLAQDQLTGHIAPTSREHHERYSHALSQREQVIHLANSNSHFQEYASKLDPVYDPKINYRTEIKTLYKLQCKRIIFDACYGLAGIFKFRIIII